jgi:hypothetical protein
LPGRPAQWCQEPLRDEVSAEEDQRDGGELLGAFSQPFADPPPECQPELTGQQGLDGDGDYHWCDREPRQAKAESDGQLIEADADPKGKQRHPASASEPPGFLLAVAVPGRQHVDPQDDHGCTGQVVGDAADRTRKPCASGKADQRHPSLEHNEDQRHPEPLPDPDHSGRPERGGDGERVHPQRENESQQPEHDIDSLTRRSHSRIG